MSRSSALRSTAAGVLVAGSAELAARLLRPRDLPAEPPRAPLESHFTAAEIQRGRAFARPQRALGLARTATDAILLAAAARRPLRKLDQLTPRPAAGALAGAGLTAALTGCGLPLGVIARRRAIAAGLVTQSWRGWAEDLAKSTALGAGFGAAAGAGVVWAAERRPRSWWILAAGGSVAVTGAMAILAPVVLDPIFNRFEPLPDGDPRRSVLRLADAAGVTVGEVLSVDASRRTTAANAYVAGLGPTKRVVLFDTLLDRYTPAEVNVVVAHELAHVRGRDVMRGIAFAAIVAPAAALATAAHAQLLGAAPKVTPSRLPAVALAAALASAPAAVVGNRLSRQLERRADELSLTLTSDAAAFISLERKLALQNLADLDPPWWTALVATHPPTAERIGHALQLARGGEPVSPPSPARSRTRAGS